MDVSASALSRVSAIECSGMGEVYRARDRRLNRDVAIKVLPEALANDATRLARFTREAQTLAALNHPNIAHVHGLEEADGVRALVMELVEGDELSAHIARGPMPIAEVLPIARQIAEALEAAHDHGIVHRDLKPANIKVRAEGTVKVLDFGLAKALEHNPGTPLSSDANAPTFTRAATEAGLILGTAAYMAPEQARGKPVDRRADIWAFGVVLYEMLTGTQVFRGETMSDTLAAVLTREPDWHALPSRTPESVRQLVRRCLERDVRKRLQSIGEARIVLEDPAALRSDSPAARPARSRILQLAAAVAGGVALFAAGWLLRPTPTAEAPVRQLDLALESADFGLGHVPVLAPDGSRMIYLAQGRLRVRRLDRLESSTDLPDSDDASYPTWSPDSQQVAYIRRNRAWRVPIDGGTPVDLGAVPQDLVGSGGSAWTADDQIVFAGSDTAGLWAMPASGGTGRDLLPLDRGAESDFHEIASLPEGRGLIFTVHRTGRLADLIAVFAGGQRRTVLELPGESLRHPFYSPTGHIVYQRETTSPGVWVVPFSLDRLETTGAPFLVVPGGSAPSVALDGTLSFVRADDTPVELVRVSRAGVVDPLTSFTGTRTSTLTGGPAGTGYQQWGGISLSPDGTRIAVSIGFSPGQIAIYDLSRGSLSVIATGTFPSRALWTKDGQTVLYASSREARAWNLWSRRADGGGEERRYSTSDEVQLPSALSPDGTTLVYSEGSGPSGSFFKMPLSDPSQRTPLYPNRVWGMAASFSPDGRYLAFESPESGRSEIYVRPFPHGDQRIQVSTDGGVVPVWTNNGEIIYVSGSAIASASITTSGGAPTVAKPVILFQTGGDAKLAPVFDVTPDGKTFFMLRTRGREQVSVILNWPRDLAQIEATGRSAGR